MMKLWIYENHICELRSEELNEGWSSFNSSFNSQGRSQDFSKGGGGGVTETTQQGHHPGIADYIWFIPLFSLVYQQAQSYYRGTKAHIN